MEFQLVINDMQTWGLTPPPEFPESDFIESALHVAKHASSKIRSEILADISFILKCEAQDLNFLFQSQDDLTQSRIYKLDLPDYRLCRSEIYLDAAE